MDEKESEKVVEETTESKDEVVVESPKKTEDVSETKEKNNPSETNVDASTSEDIHVNNVDDICNTETLKEDILVKEPEDSSNEVIEEKPNVTICENNIDHIKTIESTETKEDDVEVKTKNVSFTNPTEIKTENSTEIETALENPTKTETAPENPTETEKAPENPTSPDQEKSADISSPKSLTEESKIEDFPSQQENETEKIDESKIEDFPSRRENETKESDESKMEEFSSQQESEKEETEDVKNSVLTSTIEPTEDELPTENDPPTEISADVAAKEISSPIANVPDEPVLVPVSSGEDSNNQMQAESAHSEEHADSLSRVENVSPDENLDSELDDQNVKSPEVSDDKQNDPNDCVSENNLFDVSVNSADVETLKMDHGSKDDDANFKSNESLQNGPDKSPGNNEDDDEKENKIEKMDIDESIVEDNDKDKLAKNPLEETPNEASHSSDPFDELLDHNQIKNSSESSDPKVCNVDLNDIHCNDHDTDDIDNNDNDMDVDNDHDDTNADNDGLLDEEHSHVDDEALSDHIEADIAEGAGADEEICLLPDTEREITEADKLKALSVKKSTDTVSDSASAFDSLLSTEENAESQDVEHSKDLVKGEFVADANMQHTESTEDLNESAEHGVEDDIEEEDLRDNHDFDKEKDDEDEQEIEPESSSEASSDVGLIREVKKSEQNCHMCNENKMCAYRLMIDHETKYLCETQCFDSFQEKNPNKYKLFQKKIILSEVVNPEIGNCIQCGKEKDCYYRYLSEEYKVNLICGAECVKSILAPDPEKYTVRKKKKMVNDIVPKLATCFSCSESKDCELETMFEGEEKYICSKTCLVALQNIHPYLVKAKRKKGPKSKQQPLLKLKVISNATDKYLDERNKVIGKTHEEARAAREDRDRSFFRKCAQCEEPYIGNDKNLSWETMDFCNEICLGKYQNTHGLHCANCKNAVSMVSLGKYCVRFGYDIRQFCCSGCLDEFKKGLKICCYCQKDISVGFDGFLAPVGDQGQFKDFCSQFCVEKFDQMSKNPIPPPIWTQCAVCSVKKHTTLEVAIDEKTSQRLCSEPCFAAFKFVNNVFPDQCRWCKKYFERKSIESYTIYTDAAVHCFCSKTCMNVYISNSRHIVPCNWCKVKKYNFDMIKRTLDNGQSLMMCSLNCLTLYQVSMNAVSSKRTKCDQCKQLLQAQYHLTMSDATIRNFCSYQCVMVFQRQYSKSPMVPEGDSHVKQAVPTGAPRRTYPKTPIKALTNKSSPKNNLGRSGLPVISNVQSLAESPIGTSGHTTRAKSKRLSMVQDKPPTPPPAEPQKPPTPPPPPPPKIYNHVVIKPAPPKEVRNMSTLTKPLMVTKGVSCRPHPCSKEVQTDDFLQKRILIPIPVPIYVPTPMAMYSLPFPVPVPIPLPIPIPVFIPTTRNSASGIMKEIKKIHDKMPTDPFEAELLMMAEMVAGDKKKCESDSESDEENGDDGFSPDTLDTGNNAFGEDVLQMAFKMATEYSEPAVDLESAMTASTITPSSHPSIPTGLDENNPMHHHQLMLLEQQRVAAAAAVAAANVGRKRRGGGSPVNATMNTRSKRSRRAPETPTPHHAPEPPREPQEKPDANMCLKYTFGVNAWKQWVVTKNSEMEKSTVRRKPFKSEILQLTADELNYSLCLFVKEVRKPNGSEYAPDTIYYLVLGIQQYLFENGRIDNIFTDSYYEKFTECLDEVARKFSVLYNDSQYIVTRVEEEHLWESKQLGAHSPHVLLSTLMFFNTKHFNLVTVEEHMQLSFSHIMKHWKRNPNQPGATKIPGSRNVLLRFYPPQSALDANSRKKKVYEQQENEDNPLRCPVKLYEFYLSKCPESVKTRNDVFYLMPERSCVPDSPVWYSTQALGREPLSKMLHRVKMVKEINIALLTS